MTRPLHTRFDEKVDKTGDCWMWTGAIGGNGYGSIKHEGKTVRAHRVSHELHIGPIPEGMMVCHRCDVRACVNPAHFFLGTNLDNMRDMYSKGRRPAPAGERNGRAKLTNEQVALILADKRPSEKLGPLFNVSGSQVRNIRRSVCWASVTHP
jgi:hypothetical protein